MHLIRKQKWRVKNEKNGTGNPLIVRFCLNKNGNCLKSTFCVITTMTSYYQRKTLSSRQVPKVIWQKLKTNGVGVPGKIYWKYVWSKCLIVQSASTSHHAQLKDLHQALKVLLVGERVWRQTFSTGFVWLKAGWMLTQWLSTEPGMFVFDETFVVMSSVLSMAAPGQDSWEGPASLKLRPGCCNVARLVTWLWFLTKNRLHSAVP